MQTKHDCTKSQEQYWVLRKGDYVWVAIFVSALFWLQKLNGNQTRLSLMQSLSWEWESGENNTTITVPSCIWWTGVTVLDVWMMWFVSVSRILGLVVDHIDGLIEEWYPGLTTIDPMQGQDLLVKYVPCCMCTGMSFKKSFNVKACNEAFISHKIPMIMLHKNMCPKIAS